VAHYERDFRQAKALLAASLEVLGDEGDQRIIAWTIGDLGNLASCDGDYARAQELLQESLTVLRQIGNKDGIYWRLLQLGHLVRCQGGNEQARALFEESLSVARELGGRLEIGLALEGLAILARSGSNERAAWTLFAESLRVLRESGQKPAIAHCLWLTGIFAVQQGNYATGVRLIGSAKAHTLFGTLLYPPELAEGEAALSSALAMLGEATFTHLWSEGKTMPFEEAVAYALRDAEGAPAGTQPE